MHAHRAFAARPESAGEARRFVAGQLRSARCEALVEPATLLVSELVTNALLHAGTDVDVRVDVAGDRLRVEVHDLSPAPPRRRHYGLDASTGRGLHMLDAVASDWGVQATSTGKAMWFTISTMHPSAGETPPP